ncbi:hypothetical protein [Desulfosporosinus youngiae]|uniref:Uncharacterized protein n=1 Tax=Desulfosporosinus youngiae DSM 17734 TaxID=768710 RepID=H5Y4I1_9FIRM|nr:hypothetical protein DesyoDRAFT_2506 [Desulfosporosinus youngiae DSM 17734]
MSINETRLSNSIVKKIPWQQIVLKQYLYKLKGHSGLIYSLIFTQLLGLLSSLGMRGSMSSGGEFIWVSVNTYSGDVILIFSFIWIIIVSSLIGSQSYRSIGFSVVSNRMTDHTSNIMLLLTSAVFAGVTGVLMSVGQRIIMIMTQSEGEFLVGELGIAPQNLLLGIFVASLYLILLAAITYLIQTISTLNKTSAIILGMVILTFGFGYIRIFAFNFGNLMGFYISESSLELFVLKVFSTVCLLFGLSMFISKLMEVKR